MDDLIISAALGTSMTGENGSTSTAFATATQQIAVGGTGMTVAKLRQARNIGLFRRPAHRAAVAVADAVAHVDEIEIGVDLDDVQRAAGKGADAGDVDRMVAAKDDRDRPGFKDRADAGFDIGVAFLGVGVHDIGELYINPAYLSGNHNLKPSEWRHVASHPLVSKMLMDEVGQFPPLVGQIVLEHHERFDGSGYPRGLAGLNIPESARIVTLADVFDALSMKRPYKAPWPMERIITHLKNGAGQHFDPRLVEAFMAILPTILAIQADWNSRERPSNI